MSKKIGWATYETIGLGFVHPMIYVVDVIRRNKEIVNSSNLKELIKLCFFYCPDRKADILDRIETAFPHLEDKIDKYRILV